MTADAPQHQADRSAAKSRLLARFQRYSSLLARKWWILALGICLGLGAQTALYFTKPPSFVSVGRMIVSIKLAIPEGSVYTEELSNFLGTQMALMQSGVVVNRAHTRVLALLNGATAQPVELRVSSLPKTTIFVLQATGSDAKYTQIFLQSVMDEYTNLKKEMRAQTSDTTLAGLTDEVLRLKKELQTADTELAAFQGTNSVVLLQEQGNSAGNYLTALNQKLAMLKSEHELLRTLTLDQNLERQHGVGGTIPLASDPSAKTGQQAMETDYLRARQQVLLLKGEMDDLGQYLKPRHPKMIALSEEIGRREKLLEIYRKQGAEQLESRKTSLVLQIENVEKEVKEWDAKTLDISKKTAQYHKLKADSQRIQALYDRLLATMQTLDVNKEISPESVTIMEPASAGFPARATLVRELVLGALAGIALGLLVLLLIDRLDDRMLSYTELQELFDEPVLGQIPFEKSPAKGSDVALIEPDDERFSFVEAYRNLRSSLLFAGEKDRRPRILLVTSSVPDEGKSLTASNLAICMAESGSRVLLIDADLRKGGLHGRFGTQANPGLSNLLADSLPWEEMVQTTRHPNLSFLPRGTATQRSGELFISAGLHELLEAAGGKYDYVVLDNAPVMAADDVSCIAPFVDGVVFVLRAEHTSARVARAALEMLYQRRSKVLGLVFNAVKRSNADYHYYKYHDYYQTYPTEANRQKVG